MAFIGDRPIVLINPLYRREWEYIEDNPAAVLPLGILSIATVLSEKGYKVKIIDAYTNREYMSEVERAIEDAPLFFGISAMTAQLYSALDIARFIRKRSVARKIPIVWGGIHPTIFPESTAKDPRVDVVGIGLGEYTCLELAEEFSRNDKPQLKNIKGIAFYEDGKFFQTPPRDFTDINSLPYMNYDLLDIEKYIYRDIGYRQGQKRRSLVLYTGVGCPFRCTFCANVALHNRRYSGKSAIRILDELGCFIRKYDIEYISFCDELFFVQKNRIEEFLDGVLERQYKFNWYANIRADCFKADFLSEEMVRKMKNAGCDRLGMGVESGSQLLLDKVIKKDIRLEYVLESARLCRHYDIAVGYSFMMGLPEEKKEDILKTLEMMQKLKKLHPKSFFFGPQVYIPFPGSELYKYAVGLGFNEPSDLEGWAKEEMNKNLQGKLSGEYLWNSFDPARLPWVKHPHLIRHIDFMQNFLFRDLRGLKLDLKYPIKIALIAIARFRVRFKYWRFPVEYWIYRLLVRANQYCLQPDKRFGRTVYEKTH